MLLHVNLLLPLPLELPACVLLFTSLCYWTTILNNCKWTASITNAKMPAKVPVDKIVIFWKAKKQKWITKSSPLSLTGQYSSLISTLDFVLNWPHFCSIHSILVHRACLCCCICTTKWHHLPEKSCFQPLFNAWKCFNAGTSTFNVIIWYKIHIWWTFVLFLNHTNICTTVLCGPLCMLSLNLHGFTPRPPNSPETFSWS